MVSDYFKIAQDQNRKAQVQTKQVQEQKRKVQAQNQKVLEVLFFGGYFNYKYSVDRQ